MNPRANAFLESPTASLTLPTTPSPAVNGQITANDTRNANNTAFVNFDMTTPNVQSDLERTTAIVCAASGAARARNPLAPREDCEDEIARGGTLVSPAVKPLLSSPRELVKESICRRQSQEPR